MFIYAQGIYEIIRIETVYFYGFKVCYAFPQLPTELQLKCSRNRNILKFIMKQMDCWIVYSVKAAMMESFVLIVLSLLYVLKTVRLCCVDHDCIWISFCQDACGTHQRNWNISNLVCGIKRHKTSTKRWVSWIWVYNYWGTIDM